jgi:tetratricopeptide (TPR) repeat protein
MEQHSSFRVTLHGAEEEDKPFQAQIYQRWYAHVHIHAARERMNLLMHYQEQDGKLDDELANVCLSRAWLASREGEEEHLLHLAYIDVLAPHLYRRNRYTEILQWCEDGQHSCEQVHRNASSLMLLKGKTLNALGNWTETQISYQEAIQLSREYDPYTHARAVLALGQLQFNQGTYALALETLTKAEHLLAALSEYELLAEVSAERANYFLNRGDLDKALVLYLEEEQRRVQAGGARNPNLLMLGVVYRKKKEYERARDYLQQLLALGEAQYDRNTIATASHHLAWIAFEQESFATARKLCGKALALYEDLGDRRGLSDALEQLGRIVLAERHPQEAVSFLQQSLLLRQELQNKQGAASSLSHLALVYVSLGRLLTALSYLGQCLLAYRSIGMLSRQRMKTILWRFFQQVWRSWR